MGIEIERKFLVSGDGWRSRTGKSSRMVQGYMRTMDATVRVRIDGEHAFLTIKGQTTGLTRGEWEYEVPVTDAEELLHEFCAPRTIDKIRHYIEHEGHEWTIDEFAGRHEGLLLAEIELESEDEEFARPDWLGAEVSGDPKYYNSQLAQA